MQITAYDLAQRFVGIRETAGLASNPQVLAMLRLVNTTAHGDDIPWCSAFVNYVAWLLRLPRSNSLLARSWLSVGRPVTLAEAKAGFDVVILSRGKAPQPGPEVLNAHGHVGFFAGIEGDRLLLLGGNQADSVCVAGFPATSLLGIRRLVEE